MNRLFLFVLHRLLSVLSLVMSLLLSAGAFAVDWTITDLGTLGGTYSGAFDINARGHIVGSSTRRRQTVDRAFLHDGTTMRDLGTLGGTASWAHGINAGGQVVGGSTIMNDDTINHAFLYDGTTMRDLGTLGGTNSVARSINASQQVVGASDMMGNIGYHAFLYDGTTMRDLGTLGGTSSIAYDINTLGQVVGWSYTSGNNGNTISHAFLYDGTTMRDLDTLGGIASVANSINASGQVVGSSLTSANIGWRAFLYDGTTMRDLGTLEGTDIYTSSMASDINAVGQVVGQSHTSSGATHAFLYDGVMRDLNTLPEVMAAGWQSLTESSPLTINDSGQIVGTGMIGSRSRAFRLHPQTTSRYMQTVNPTTLYNLGCSQTNQRGVLVLNFGAPRYNGTDYGTTLYQASGFTPILDIETAMRAFLDGYYYCNGRPGNGVMTVAVGTTSFGSQVTSAHGVAWGQMLARLNAFVSGPPYLGDRLSVAGAIDIELDVRRGWATPANARAWVDGYASTSPVSYYNYGDAQGCPTAGIGPCSNGWAQEDVWYVSWGNPANPLPVPQIYRTDSSQAQQWSALAAYGNAVHGTEVFIPAALTQWQACRDPGRNCPGRLRNTPVQAWYQLMDALYAVIPDPNAVQNILYSSDITWQN